MLCIAAFIYINIKLEKLGTLAPEQTPIAEEGMAEDEIYEQDDVPAGSEQNESAEKMEPEDVVWAEDPADPEALSMVTNILLIGQDRRPEESGTTRSDAIMIVSMNAETKKVTLVSIMRDTYVQIPGHVDNRINAAYRFGGASLLYETIEKNFGLKIDGTVGVDFSGFVDVINAVGGVDIDLQGDELAKMLEYQGYRNAHFEYVGIEKRFDLQEGVNTLDGYLALAYARERHMSNADSDIQRTARQRKVIESLLNKLSKMSLSQINSLIDQVLAEIVTDISTDDMKMYITELVPYLFDLKLESYQVPAEGTYWGEMVELPDGLSGVLKIDFPKNKQVVAAIQSGEEVPTFK